MEPPLRDDFAFLTSTAAELVLPDGLGAEVLDGKIVITPWLPAPFLKPLRTIQRQLDLRAGRGRDIGALSMRFGFPAAVLGPDLSVYETARLDPATAVVPGEALLLAAEVTTPATRDLDADRKAEIYGRAGVPVFLLFDTDERMLTVHADPGPDRGYRTRSTSWFGEPAEIPAPFAFDLDTTAFTGI